MKLVQLLAKELKEWPEDDEGSDPILFITQNASGAIFSWNDNGELKFVDGQWYMQGTIPFDDVIFDGSETCSDCSSAIVREDQWHYEREKINKPKWIRHRGGRMPVGAATIVEVRLRCGDIQKHEAYEFLWRHKDCDSAANIMAYRVIEETKDQEIEEVETIDTAKAPTIEYAFGDKDSDPNDLDWKQLGTLTYKLEIDATEATNEIDSLVAKWGQIESPLKWRDEIIELEAYEEEFRREREKLIRKLESEGFKLIDHMTPVYGEQIIGMNDWQNWKVGDIVCATQAFDSIRIGEELTITRIDHADEEQTIGMSNGSSCVSWPETNQVKFVRRP